ncbi:hypothetical protein [Oceanobacillus sp. CAU 1775]
MKNFLRTFKGKVVALLLTVGVITGAGAALASTNAGDQLKIWYDSMFNQTVDSIESDVGAYADDMAVELAEEYEDLKVAAGIDIDLGRELATGESLESIVQAKLEHLDELEEGQQEILENIGLQFYNVFLDGYFEIQRNTNEGLEYATNDLTEYVGDLSDSAIDQMTTDITSAQDQAVSDLEEAIRQAQDQLANELASQETVTTNNLYSQVNWAVEDLRTAVTGLLNDMVSEQQTVIVEKALELETEAKAALDAVISNINNN